MESLGSFCSSCGGFGSLVATCSGSAMMGFVDCQRIGGARFAIAEMWDFVERILRFLPRIDLIELLHFRKKPASKGLIELLIAGGLRGTHVGISRCRPGH